ncbi:cell division protein ZapA [Endothiovibrio diazotrophicus]
MSSEVVPVNVKILDKEYQVACPEEERAGLVASAEHLNQRMLEIRRSGKVFGADRIAVMAALNLAHELLQSKGGVEELDRRVSERLKALEDRVGKTLIEARRIESE